MPGTHRLFVAISPPDPVRRRVARVAEDLRAAAAGKDVRWVADENVHVTLQFLGAVPEARVADVEGAVRAAAAAGRPISLEVAGAGGFPSARRPRVVWLGLAGEIAALGVVVADLGARLAPLGFTPEERAFAPHLTLGRSRDPRGAPGLAPALTTAAAAEPIPWRVADLVLFESHLSPKGPRYEARLRAPLGSS